MIFSDIKQSTTLESDAWQFKTRVEDIVVSLELMYVDSNLGAIQKALCTSM